jgi:hypothetical protein
MKSGLTLLDQSPLLRFSRTYLWVVGFEREDDAQAFRREFIA